MDVSDLELSKENIQPLRQGRKVSSLNVGLQAEHSDEVQKQLIEQKQIFETQIRVYEGPDPLDPWNKYIEWVQQTCPKGSQDLPILIEKCIVTFQNVEMYKQDTRYVDIWLQYVEYSPAPLEFLNHMFAQDVGTRVAKLYVTWAWYLEQAEEFQKAATVFQEGIKRVVQSREDVECAQRQFELRVASILHERQMNCDTPPEKQNVRPAFTALNATGKKKSVGSVRIGKGPPGTLQPVQPLQQHNGKKQIFMIHEDENVPSHLSANGEGETVVLHRNKMKKENELKPGKWKDVKVPQKNSAHMRTTLAHQMPASTFQVYQDDDIESLEDAHIVPVSNALCKRKVQDLPVLPCMYSDPDFSDPSINYNFNRKVYSGAQEFSFEELRAATWLSKNMKGEENIMSLGIRTVL